MGLEGAKRFVPAPLKAAGRRGALRLDSARNTARTVTGSVLVVDGVCAICGEHGRFREPVDSNFAARSFPCPACAAPVRFRNEAAVILDELGTGRHLSLQTFVDDAVTQSLSWYNTGIAGPVCAALRQLPNYVESTYWPDDVADTDRRGIRHEDLQALSFDDDTFDVVTSSHVLEHVAEPAHAFSELFRVVRPGGRLIFSIPISWPPPHTSIRRAHVEGNTIVHDLPAMYHDAPDGEPSLVFTDFGSDVLESLADAGFIASQRRPHLGVQFAQRDSVFVAIKA